ncbi:hypothetical protein TWF225_003740 [Orbilia oligospora]|nr:hypothetical protein TWF751_003508 [Orbilia oligospora]KAF3195341.1 hypothetical protein TWF225_003740 [Orbilia oligospora]KAF3254201.1 hypothetical protein TWF217_007171 [Orbilia oligospora]KAF3267659.1 hypothetical protein TWF128_009174 [Orbilia oligospora]KAF3298158.1 hypothetical protein TWF132_000003 [Orbilia oligospora]
MRCSDAGGGRHHQVTGSDQADIFELACSAGSTGEQPEERQGRIADLSLQQSQNRTNLKKYSKMAKTVVSALALALKNEMYLIRIYRKPPLGSKNRYLDSTPRLGISV